MKYSQSMEDQNMKNNLKYFGLIIFGISLSIAVSAQEKKNEIPEALKNAQVWIGKWSGTMTMTMEGKTYKPKATWTFRSIAGGYGITLEQVQKDPELGTMLSEDMMGYDPFDKKIHVYTVDNMGTCHDHICEWKSPGHFYLEHNSMRSGKPYQEKIDMEMKGKDTFETNYVGLADGKVTDTGKGTFKRAK
jgi:hypothetical protein